MSAVTRAAAVLAAAVLALSGLAVAGAPAAQATTCPSGSQPWPGFDVQHNSPDVVQNADNFGPGGITCFSDTGTAGQLTVTQADHGHTDSVLPTSYPSDDWGCSLNFCSASWTTESWNQPNPLKITTSFDNTGVSGSDVYDYMLDQLFTDSSHTGTGPPTLAEVEVVLNAKPTFPAAGFCRSTGCGAVQVTVNGVSWWLTIVTGGAWPRYIYARNTAVSSVTGLNLKSFYSNANSQCSPAGCLSGLYLDSTWSGTELWPKLAGDGGLGVTVTSAQITGEP